MRQVSADACWRWSAVQGGQCLRSVMYAWKFRCRCRSPEVAVSPWSDIGLRKTNSLVVKVRAVVRAPSADRVREAA